MTIVFAVHHGAGHANSSLTLARPLRERGHRVVYYGLAAGRAHASREGFEHVAFAEDLLPEGTPWTPPPGPCWKRERAARRAFNAFLERCSNGTMDAQLEGLRPDVVVCDSLIWYVGLRALRLRLPVAGIEISLSSPPNPHSPPLRSHRVPRDTWWGRMQVRGDWARLRCQILLDKQVRARLNTLTVWPHRIHASVPAYDRLARAGGVGWRRNIDYWLGLAGPALYLPEIYICPRSFDFALAPNAGRVYAAGATQISRQEDTSLIETLPADKPLVYCSLGSDSHVYPHSRRFFHTVAAASRLRPDWHWIVSVGPRFDCREFAAGPNLTVAAWAPQIALLRRAAAMVTHGGINSVMECVQLGTPMVIVPGARDQPGNMARAVFHGIAVGDRMKGLRAGRLVALLERAMNSQEMRAAQERMRQAIAAEDGLVRALHMIESLGAK